MGFIKKIIHNKEFKKNRPFWILLLVCFLFVLLRLPSLIEPNWYKDEGIYQVVAKAILSGRTLYKDIWDNKPPLLYLIYALSNSDLYITKTLSLIAGIFSIIAFYFLTKKILLHEKMRYISVVIFSALLGLPVLEGNIANAENFMLPASIVAALYVWRYLDKSNIKNLVIAGLILSFAFATKVVAIFDFFAFSISIIIIKENKNYLKKIYQQAYFLFPFISLMLLFFIYFLSIGAGKDFLNSVFFQNVPYVGEQSNSLFPVGVILIKTALLIAFISLIYNKRGILPSRIIFIYLWLIFSLYSAFFSARPYTHYLLVLIPSLSLMLGHLLESKKTLVINSIVLITIILVAYFYFPLYKKNFAYYLNYLSFLTGGKSTVEYQSFFDSTTPRDYFIAQFIKKYISKNDSVFVWSDSAQIYQLADRLPLGRYTASYHVLYHKDAENEVIEYINKSEPRYFISTSDETIFSHILSSYKLKYIIDNARIYERKI